MYSLLLQRYTTELEGNMKGVDTYDAVEMDQYGIDLEKIIHSTCHL